MNATSENLLRELAPQVLGAVIRRFGDFSTAEDAVQEALIAAADQWPRDGVPERPRAWLVRTAERRLIDQHRSEAARADREFATAIGSPATPDDKGISEGDDSLVLLFLCCHPSLTPASAIALTLRAVGGLTTDQIAKAFLVPESTMGQRIARAKRTIRDSGLPFRMPDPDERPARLRSVLHVLYLIFNEGYAASSGERLQRVDLADEAIRLTRMLDVQVPDEPEIQGLLALMLLLDARGAARTDAAGELVPLAEQDRARWDRTRIAEGTALLDRAFGAGRVGEYQLQAAIAALHDRAPTAADTDWAQIEALYVILERMTRNPIVTVNRAVAAAMVHGPAAGLAILDGLGDALPEHHRVDAVRAHLLEGAGDVEGAIASYHAAARTTTSLPEQRYLTMRAARLRSTGAPR